MNLKSEKSIKEYLNNVEIYEGASGTLVSDGKGGFVKGYVVKEVRNGTAVTI